MFGCCCVSKKALKKEQQKVVDEVDCKAALEKGSGKEREVKNCDSNNVVKSPQNPAEANVASYKSPIKNDKSNSSDEDNNLSGLIMSDGLVGEAFQKLFERVKFRLHYSSRESDLVLKLISISYKFFF